MNKKNSLAFLFILSTKIVMGMQPPPTNDTTKDWSGNGSTLATAIKSPGYAFSERLISFS